MSSGGDSRHFKSSPHQLEVLNFHGNETKVPGYNTEELLRDTSSATSSEPDFEKYQAPADSHDRRVKEELAMRILQERYLPQ